MTSRALHRQKFKGQPALVDLAFFSLSGVMSWDFVHIEENGVIVVFLMTNSFAVFPLCSDKNSLKYKKIIPLDGDLTLLAPAPISSINNSHRTESGGSKKPIAVIVETNAELLIKYYSINVRWNQMQEVKVYRPKCHFGKNYEGKLIGVKPHWLFIAYWKSKKSSWWPSRTTSDETTSVFVGTLPKETASLTTSELEEHKLELEGSWHLPFIAKVRNERNINGNIGVFSENLTLNFLSQAPFNQLLQICGSSVRDSVRSPQTYFSTRSKQMIIDLFPSDENLFPPTGMWSWPQIFENRAYFYIFVSEKEKEAIGELWSLALSDYRWRKEKIEWKNTHIVTAHRPVLTVTEKGSAFVNMECLACCSQHVFQFDIGTLKNFVIDWNRKIGNGLFGNVFAAESSSIGHFAAKTVHIGNERGASLSAQQKMISAAIDGARRLRSVSHPNIIKGFGFVLERERFVHFTELMAQTLLHVIKVSNGIDESHAMRVLLSISDALFYLHSLHPTPVVHGDIKCASIFISDDGRMKLGDFSIMMDISITGTDQQCFDSGLISSVIAKKLHWMAPEVLQKETIYSRPADVWSLGCTLVEMLTGSPPYKNYTTYDWITAHHKGLLTYDVQQLVPNLSDDLSELLEQLFRRKTTKRTNDESDLGRLSAGEILIRLKEIAVEREVMQKKQEIDELRSIVLCNDYCSEEEFDEILLLT